MKPRRGVQVAPIAGLAVIAAAAAMVAGRRPLERPAARLAALVSKERIGREIERLSRRPHRAGTEANRAVADAIASRMRDAGLEVTTSDFGARLPEPGEASLALVAPEPHPFDLHEKSVGGDPGSRSASDELPFFAWAPDGDVEGDVVYANFGAREDYALLKSRGIGLRGRIALVRAQGICRSMKAIVAGEEGIAGLLLYPELRDQGFRKPRWPEGPATTTSTVQRGSMLAYFLRPGAPEAGAVDTRPSVPALPISEETAAALLRVIEGDPAPEPWTGWLRVPYRLGAGPARVRLRVAGVERDRTLRNVTAVLKGSSAGPPVVVGAHYDAWVAGAIDPISGVAVVMEAAEALAGVSRRSGPPMRDVVFAFFDGEEYGMLGSTRWVHDRAASAAAVPAAFVYVDSSVRAYDFMADVSPLLRGALDDVLREVPDPATSRPIVSLRGDFQLPGFSGDTSPFVALAGVPAVELGYGRRTYAMYHSVFDQYGLISRYVDPGFVYSATLARILGLYVLRLSTGAVPPYRFSEIADFVEGALPTLTALTAARPDLASRLAPVRDALRDYRGAAEAADSGRSEAGSASRLSASRAFFLPVQKTTRPFCCGHALVGPSEANGCGAEALPGLSRAMRPGDLAAVDTEVEALSRALADAAAHLRKRP